jgi:hypothetical protein
MIEIQFKEMEKRFDEMEERFDKLEASFDKFVERLELIYAKLAGNALNPEGLVKEMETLKEKVRVLEEYKSRSNWTVFLMFVIGGAVSTILTLILMYLQIK